MSLSSVCSRLEVGFEGRLRRNEPLSRHTTYRIGGPAALFAECDSLRDLTRLTQELAEEQLPWLVLGKGSNILASDEGYDGAIIVLGRDFKRHSIDDTHLRTGAGVILASLVQEAFRCGRSGLEFAVGIPGTVGGALAMNAGSREEWIGSTVETVTLLDPANGLTQLRGDEVAWSYRRTDLSARGIVVEASLRLEAGDAAQIRRVMEASLRRRKRTQPLAVPNAGSVFVNPEGDSAGRLIEAAGMKGACVGGAQVSEVHANFIVNTGGATAADVMDLMASVREAVKDQHGIELRPEVRLVGSFERA